MFMFSICVFMDGYTFLEWSQAGKCENDTRTFIINLILILTEIHKKGKGTHCWLKTNDTER
jgi:hypothetical protein